MKRTIALLVCLVIGLGTGCDFGQDASIKQINDLTKVVVNKAAEATTADTLSFHGSVQGQNPGYTVKVRGVIINGFEGEAKVYIDGVSGQMSLATQGRTTTTQPGVE